MAEEELFDVIIPPGVPKTIIIDIMKKFDVQIVEQLRPRGAHEETLTPPGQEAANDLTCVHVVAEAMHGLYDQVTHRTPSGTPSSAQE